MTDIIWIVHSPLFYYWKAVIILRIWVFWKNMLFLDYIFPFSAPSVCLFVVLFYLLWCFINWYIWRTVKPLLKCHYYVLYLLFSFKWFVNGVITHRVIKRSHKCPMEKLKANSIASTICLTSSKKSGGEGRIKTWEAQGSVSGTWSHPSSVSWWAHTVLGPQRQGVLGTQGPPSLPPQSR